MEETGYEHELGLERFRDSERLDHQKRYWDRDDRERLTNDLHLSGHERL